VAGRREILALYLEGKPLAPDVDVDLMARCTPGVLFRLKPLGRWPRDSVVDDEHCPCPARFQSSWLCLIHAARD